VWLSDFHTKFLIEFANSLNDWSTLLCLYTTRLCLFIGMGLRWSWRIALVLQDMFLLVKLTLLKILLLTCWLFGEIQFLFAYLFSEKIRLCFLDDKTQFLMEKTLLRIIPPTSWFFNKNKILLTHLLAKTKSHSSKFNSQGQNSFKDYTILKFTKIDRHYMKKTY
jgi:hypothetical protein